MYTLYDVQINSHVFFPKLVVYLFCPLPSLVFVFLPHFFPSCLLFFLSFSLPPPNSSLFPASFAFLIKLFTTVSIEVLRLDIDLFFLITEWKLILLTMKFAQIILLVPFVRLGIFPYNSNSLGSL